MKVFVVVSSHYLGNTDAAYLHGVFGSEELARKMAAEIEDTEVYAVEMDELQKGDRLDDYNRLPGIRLI